MVSFRRTYLDRSLHSLSWSGNVLDIGGERNGARGTFKPEKTKANSWKFINSDLKTDPDLLCSADSIPLQDESAEFVVCTEVLEHVQNPEQVLRECYRLLKQNHTLVLSIPYLVPTHADPYDYQRWTPYKIKSELTRLGFQEIKIQPMGGILAVMADCFEMDCWFSFRKYGKLNFFRKILRFFIRKVFLKPLMTLDQNYPYSFDLTTGYFITAKK